MSIRVRLFLFGSIVTVAIVAIAATSLLTFRSTAHFLGRVQWTHAQLEAITALAVHANRYSEQIAEMLLLGQSERADFDLARSELEQAFARLDRTTHGEIEFVGDAEEVGAEEVTARTERLRGLFGEIDRAAERLFVLADQGHVEQATALFRTSIEDRLDHEFDAILQVAMQHERAEVVAAGAEAVALEHRLTVLVMLVGLGAILVCVVGGILFGRALVVPIDRLAAGADAIGRGDLTHRMEVSGVGELAGLSRRFNEMSALLAAQRDRVREVQANLESEVAGRTAELRAANERLKEVDRLRSQFLTDISHELRTPLTILRGEGEIALRGRHGAVAQYREALERIVDQAVVMTRLVDDILFLARAEAGTLRIDRKLVPLADVLNPAVQEARALARAKGIRIDAQWSKDPVLVRADQQRLKQALLIALDNAVKYSDPEGEIRLAAEPDQGSIVVTVTDSGAGIPPDEQPYVFERFFRGGSNGVRPEGIGLGLPIARWLIEEHEGTIAIAEAAPRGTCLTIRLPRAEAP